MAKKYEYEVSVVIPCLNEEKTIAQVITKSIAVMKKNGIKGEVVVSDNGSTDKSVMLAKKAGARVVHQPLRGYGNAYHKGFAEAKGRFMIMGDADNTYDMNEIPRFIEPLREGYEFVIGNRLKGTIHPGAMPWHHRWIGNPVLSWILRVLFGNNIADSHCGMRAFTREAYDKMDLQTTGMEFASEMVIKAVERKLKIKQIVIDLYARPKGSESKLHSFRDGWRHLRFMVLYSPIRFFLAPGLTLFILGALMFGALIPGPVVVQGLRFDTRYMLLGSMMMIAGYQIVSMGLFTLFYRVTNRFDVGEKELQKMHKFMTLERGLFLGTVLFLIGVGLEIAMFAGSLESLIRYSIIALTFIVLGLQTIFTSMFLSILRVEHK